MLFQLGNIEFKGLFGPSSFEVEGLEAVYAEHQLINGKSRLQPTGSMLNEVVIKVYLHAEFCNPEAQIADIKQAIDNSTIMPMLMGNGKFINDFVIISAPYTVNEMLGDGTIKAATVTLTIREFVTADKLEQKRSAALQSAFAVGDKNPVIKRPSQVESQTSVVAKTISAAKQQSTKVDGLVSEYQNNVSKRQALGKKIMDTCQTANQKIDSLDNQLNDVRQDVNNFTGVKGAVASLKTAYSGITNLYPFDNVTDLMSANNYLQTTTGTLGSISAPLLQLVAIRQPL